jgi:hypothetical protein
MITQNYLPSDSHNEKSFKYFVHGNARVKIILIAALNDYNILDIYEIIQMDLSLRLDGR